MTRSMARPMNVAFATTTTAAAMLMAVTALWFVPARGEAAPDALQLRPVDGTSWRDVLDRAVGAAAQTAYEASMVIVTIDDDGPGVTEVSLRKGRDGQLAVAAAESWLIARDDRSVVFRDDQTQQLRQLGPVTALPFSVADVARHYKVTVDGQADLATGPAVAVSFSRGGVRRERLFGDQSTGLVVRRETYDSVGAPVRVAALTDLNVRDVHLQGMPTTESDVLMPRRSLSAAEAVAMSDEAGPVPTSLGDGFDLREGFALEGRGSMQLVYSDGLYTVSVLDQPGRVDRNGLDGAVREVYNGIPVYRWPGAQPLRMVWNGDGRTFTAVTDAPADVLMPVVDDLPHDVAASMPARVGRGLARLGGWLWPFG